MEDPSSKCILPHYIRMFVTSYVFPDVVLFGSWYEHVRNWWEKKETYSNLQFVFYEDMIKDTKRELDRLCSFFGLFRSSEEKEQIIAKVKFDEMQKNKKVNASSLPMFNLTNALIRKGKIGMWKNYFTVAQNEEFEKHLKNKM